MQEAARPRLADDGSIVFAGRRYEGAQARYIAQARGICASHQSGEPADGLTREERKALMAYRLAQDGIPYEIWTRWSFDQVWLYFEGRRVANEMRARNVERLVAQYAAAKAESPVRFTVPLE